jgi:SAM-dependent MidA family methyltransferase
VAAPAHAPGRLTARMTTARPWREAWEDALYGPGGFFLREAPRDHFRTSVTASPLFAEALRALAERVDDALGRPDPFDLVDVGAGRGELLTSLGAVPARWRLTAVERAQDPRLAGVRWAREVPPATGLLLANEWLDDVPLDVLQDGRLVLVDDRGGESLGPAAPGELLAWAERWWPGGGRVEVGLTRDRAWASAVRRLTRGLAVAVDYGHLLGGRRPTLTGHRAGRQTRPVPDSSRDLTAHVALDACAAATGARLTDQRSALRALGVDPSAPVWQGDGRAHATALQRATQAATLLDPGGLGGFGWLVRPVGIRDPLAGDRGARLAR